MANLAGFDAGAVGEMQNFEAMPAHKEMYMMVESEMKPTKAGNGSYLQCKFTNVQEGPRKGRNVWARLNLNNPNKQAEDIAQRELGAICKAVGIIKPLDSADLHNKPIILDVGVESKGTDKPQNVINGYAPVGSVTGAVTGSAPAFGTVNHGFAAPAAGAAAGAAATPPWQR